MKRSHVLLAFAVASFLCASFIGCSAPVEQSPAFKEMAKKVKELEDGKKQLAGKVEDLGLDVNTAMQDVTGIQAKLQNAAAPSPELEKQIADLTDRLTKIEQKLKMKKGQAAVEAEDGVSATKSEAVATDSAKAPAPKKKVATKKARAKTVKTTKRVSESTNAAAGGYYVVKKGDTIDSIAKANGTSAAAIASENNLPASAMLPPGQAIYIRK